MSGMLTLRAVTKVFNKGTASEVVALRNLDFSVEPGQFVTIIGSNGSGKSTLLNLVAGVYPVDEGTIALDDLDVTRSPEHLRGRVVGRVHQDLLRGTAPSMTIEENLAIASIRGRRPGLKMATNKTRRTRLVEAVGALGIGLEKRMSDRVRNLSGGERQALALVMATLVQPKLLLLDEHCASLDPRMAEVVMGMTDALVRERKITTLMVTHNIPQALKYGDRLVMMRMGSVFHDVRGVDKAAMTASRIIGAFVGGNELGV